ncbi:MAG: hypothetical protein ACYC26_07830 [Phycisphaerales bacterium]
MTNMTLIVTCLLIILSSAQFVIATDQSVVKKDSVLFTQLDSSLSTMDLRSNNVEPAKQLLSSLKHDYASGHLIQQFIIYQVETNNEMRMYAAEWMLEELIEESPQADILTSLEPMLSNAQEPVRKRATGMISELCVVKSTAVDFGPIAKLANGADAEKHSALVRFAFRNSPGDALLAYARESSLSHEQFKGILLSEHIVADWKWRKEHDIEIPDYITQAAKVELQRFMASTYWWAHLYVAVIVQKYPELSASKLVEALKQDKHPIVQEMMLMPTDKTRQ